ncbi:MarR family winged helix-turn-helix transcriptional regulator [Listeria fleischmannii]|jgi:DNA-binding MarR family transcriptional regulator|uniref:MarR family transcriptional regulator n=1 Tax=Listeria fleischmannii TaxID=1069827 RepID=A0A841YAT0_9LIST|nr:MarR family transcriptional regulator [Listeria fleischmannii]EIA19334.1 MarR family transcriptional regulator [Listeria fleischmannii subsp. coloradonensis]MBC1397370.1 MarR family transcriptional regulator [Listeria fleischmannii]MBC1419387.1 MarR family transcriptional regulator [Listeria fleischmannii]MBC1425739.1 MarR family transcriptional regulator [Listeria fleischmannii]STY35320.1 DNA-binding transcriptional repressor MarR [Listeria fleischmannii subsp. coloradonensis]
MNEKQINHFVDSYMRTYIFAFKEVNQVIEQVTLDGKNISVEQFFLLRELTKKEGMSATELSNSLNVNKSAVSAKIRNLEDKGFLLRMNNPDDRRAVMLHISEKGNSIFNLCETEMKNLVYTWLLQLGDADAELFMNLYDKVIDSVVMTQARGKKG